MTTGGGAPDRYMGGSAKILLNPPAIVGCLELQALSVRPGGYDGEVAFSRENIFRTL